MNGTKHVYSLRKIKWMKQVTTVSSLGLFIWKTCQINIHQPLSSLQSLQKTRNCQFPYTCIALNTICSQVPLLGRDFSPFLYVAHYFFKVHVHKHTLKQTHIWVWHFWVTLLFYTLTHAELPLVLCTSFSDVPVVWDSCIIWYLLYITANCVMPAQRELIS